MPEPDDAPDLVMTGLGDALLKSNAGRGFGVPPIPLGLLMKTEIPNPIDSACDVSFILEHIMNK
jgi:hypothetical protein